MKAWELQDSFDIGSLTVAERPEPQPSEGEVLVKMRACSATSLGDYGEIPREDVAEVLAAALDMAHTHGKTFEILSGETPVREALEGL